jgi:creatinine amidohydrolase
LTRLASGVTIDAVEAEVRYWMLRPAQIVERRKAFPVAYVPLGTLEWHGLHNAVGTDTLQAEGLAIRCAEKGGGLVFPPLYYGESRLESLMEANATDRDGIAAAMHLDPAAFSPARHPFSPAEQTAAYNHLLTHILAEVESLGFAVGVFVAGHYPLVDHAAAAVHQWNRRHFSRYHGLLAYACIDFLFLKDRYEQAGDHAAGWETSHMLALHPGTVDLAELPPRGEKLVGVGGRMPPHDATAEFGARIIEEAAEAIVREARDRLEHPEVYRGHGMCQREGLWREGRGAGGAG